MLRIRYGPHEKSPMHGRPPLVGIFLTPHQSRHTFPDGRIVEMHGNARDVRYMEMTEHAPENPADQPFELVAVELKA